MFSNQEGTSFQGWVDLPIKHRSPNTSTKRDPHRIQLLSPDFLHAKHPCSQVWLPENRIHRKHHPDCKVLRINELNELMVQCKLFEYSNLFMTCTFMWDLSNRILHQFPGQTDQLAHLPTKRWCSGDCRNQDWERRICTMSPWTMRCDVIRLWRDWLNSPKLIQWCLLLPLYVRASRGTIAN